MALPIYDRSRDGARKFVAQGEFTRAFVGWCVEDGQRWVVINTVRGLRREAQ